MKLRGVIDEDFVNYKKPSMFLIFPYCGTFKCEKECGQKICQNSHLIFEDIIDVPLEMLIARYHMNEITKAIVCGGLEPLDSIEELMEFIDKFRSNSNDDIVIYTGYTREEAAKIAPHLVRYKNIVIKYGRYTPNQKSHYDNTLGVYLASDNQYAIAYNYYGERE